MKSNILFSLLLIMILATSCGVSTPYDTFRSENREDFAFSLGASSFLTHMFLDKDDLQEYGEIVQGIKKYRLIIADEKAAAVNRQFERFVNENRYEELFFVKSDGSRVNLYLYKRGNKLREVIFRVSSKNELVILSAEGNLKLRHLDKLMKEVVADLNGK